MAEYETIMTGVTLSIKAEGVSHIMFGDLFLEQLRRSREANLASVGMAGLFPLWKRDTAALARAMIDSGMIIHTVCVKESHLDASFAGQRFDHDFLARLPRRASIPVARTVSSTLSFPAVQCSTRRFHCGLARSFTATGTFSPTPPPSVVIPMPRCRFCLT